MCDSPHYVVTDKHFAPKAVPVPCGRCPPCRKKRVDGWVFRMQKEDEVSSSSLFVTLTYDPQHVPISRKGYMTLSKRDVQLFFKRLRKKQPEHKIRYYAVGEYGSATYRPHYHLVLFGVVKNEFIADAWPSGGVHIGKVSGASIAYTTKYIDKDKRIPLHQHDDRIPEFSLMSKGLGNAYLTPATIAYHRADLTRNFVTYDGRHKIAMPKYYRDRIYTELDKAKQSLLIEQSVNERNAQKAIKVSRLYPGMHLDTYLSHERVGRYDRDKNKPKRLDL